MVQLKRWRANPDAFIEEALRNPESGQPFDLYPAEREFLQVQRRIAAGGIRLGVVFVHLAFRRTPGGGAEADHIAD